jgi:hypothetical protein
MARRDSRRYGVVHRKNRQRWARLVDAGSVSCVRCGNAISPGSEWHLDHDDEGTGYLGPAHARCNTSAGGRIGRERQLGLGRIDRWSRCWCGDTRDPRCPAGDACKADSYTPAVA